jgi:hypothetical protein
MRSRSRIHSRHHRLRTCYRRSLAPSAVYSVLGGTLLAFQSSLIWKAARTIDLKPAPFVLVLFGPVVVGLASGVPVLREASGSLSLFTGAAYTIATATTLWLGRKERLAARWPFIVLASMHGTALLFGTYSTFGGSTGQDAVPSLTSMFGFIYFEAIIFVSGPPYSF